MSDNQGIGRLFLEIADMLASQGEQQRRINAYRRAADSITGLGRDVADVAQEGTLTEIPGIGKILAAKIQEYLDTGTLELYERLKGEVPPGVMAMLQIPDVGPKTASRVWKELGATTIDELEAAAVLEDEDMLERVKAWSVELESLGADLEASAVLEDEDFLEVLKRYLEGFSEGMEPDLVEENDAIAERPEGVTEAKSKTFDSADPPPRWQQIGIEMVTIPEGPFLYGEKKVRVHLEEYAMAKTPVTNAQYKAFVEATDRRAPAHWRNGQIPAGKEDHPVVLVSWYDTAAFCTWAGCRLPTEQEWEKGARGADGREYPWGDGWDESRCNTREADLDDTTPVDRFPDGASGYGLLDMAGNVWEWCANWSDEKQKFTALRGGSWSNIRDVARCAYRYEDLPALQSINYGFRCVVSPTTSSEVLDAG